LGYLNNPLSVSNSEGYSRSSLPVTLASHREGHITVTSLPGSATKLVINQVFLTSEDHRSFAWLIVGKFFDANNSLLWGTELFLVRYNPDLYPDPDNESDSEEASAAVSSEAESEESDSEGEPFPFSILEPFAVSFA
jgi:hypothetical protein